jgi:hypothetical protein
MSEKATFDAKAQTSEADAIIAQEVAKDQQVTSEQQCSGGTLEVVYPILPTRSVAKPFVAIHQCAICDQFFVSTAMLLGGCRSYVPILAYERGPRIDRLWQHFRWYWYYSNCHVSHRNGIDGSSCRSTVSMVCRLRSQVQSVRGAHAGLDNSIRLDLLLHIESSSHFEHHRQPREL